ncbi:hypothetical protein ACFSTC_40310 [Nonomuraea ferruginea]
MDPERLARPVRRAARAASHPRHARLHGRDPPRRRHRGALPRGDLLGPGLRPAARRRPGRAVHARQGRHRDELAGEGPDAGHARPGRRGRGARARREPRRRAARRRLARRARRDGRRAVQARRPGGVRPLLRLPRPRPADPVAVDARRRHRRLRQLPRRSGDPGRVRTSSARR